MALIRLARHEGRSTSQAPDSINRQLRSQISDADLADLVVGLYADDGSERREPRIICSLGLFGSVEGSA